MLRCSPSPFDSILEAVLTVSPNKQYRGIVLPTTPATQGPVIQCTEYCEWYVDILGTSQLAEREGLDKGVASLSQKNCVENILNTQRDIVNYSYP